MITVPWVQSVIIHDRSSLSAMDLAAVTVTSWPASPDRENEDSTATAPQVAVVVDGAGIPSSLRSGCSHSVAWYSRTLAMAFQLHLADPCVKMRDALRSAIADVVAEHENTRSEERRVGKECR